MRLVILCLVLALSGCDERPDTWTAFVYPDATDLTESQIMTGITSFEECRSLAIDALRKMNGASRGDYECGYRCAYNTQWETHICKETRD